MLAKAAAESPDITWQHADLATWRPARTRPISSTPTPRCTGCPITRSCFPGSSTGWRRAACWRCRSRATSRPASHTSISEAARGGPWRAKLEPLLRPAPVAEPDFYYGLLAPKAKSIDMWETEYVQALEGKDPIKEWVKGTWLRPLLDALTGQERDDFEADLRAARGARVSAAPRRADAVPVPETVHDCGARLGRRRSSASQPASQCPPDSRDLPIPPLGPPTAPPYSSQYREFPCDRAGSPPVLACKKRHV